MPHPARIQPGDITRTARDIAHASGASAVTMRTVAEQLGVRAPSLYFHVRSREELLDGVICDVLGELGIALSAVVDADPSVALHAMADAYIAFAEAQPHLFELAFGPCPVGEVPDLEAGRVASEALLSTAARVTSPERVLDTAQAFWSLVHGYCVLNRAGQFALGGDPWRAIHSAIDHIVAGERVHLREGGATPALS